MATAFTLPFLTAVLISAAAAAISSTKPGPALIHEACNNAGPHLQQLCVTSLSAEPPSATADLRTLAIIAVRVAADNASQTASFYVAQQADVAAANPADPVLYQCVNDCIELYVDAADQLDTTTAAIDDGADKDALTWLEAAMADVTSCEKGCGAAATAQIAERNDGAKKLLNITMSFAHLLLAREGR